MIALTRTPNGLSYMKRCFFLFMKQCGQLRDAGNQDPSTVFPPLLRRGLQVCDGFPACPHRRWGKGNMPQKLYKSLMFTSQWLQFSYVATSGWSWRLAG